MSEVSPGTRIGPYTIKRRLNAGGMGMVFLAEDHSGSNVRNVAIKFPRLAVLHDERIIQGLFDEAETMYQFRSPRIPTVFAWGKHDGLPYVVMEFIRGVSLTALIRAIQETDHSLEFEVVAHIYREVALALHYAHEFARGGQPCHILHRDVASKNVLIDSAASVYLLDFGVVRSAQTAARGVSSAHLVKGTLSYLAPEHAAGDPCRASDVFGLHTMLWEMIEGRRFRGGLNERQLWQHAIDGVVPPLTRAGVPIWMQDLLTQGLHRDHNKRIELVDVLTTLENETRPRTMALRWLIERTFKGLAGRTGSTLHDGGPDIGSELLKAIGAAKAAQEPLGVPEVDASTIAASALEAFPPTRTTQPPPAVLAQRAAAAADLFDEDRRVETGNGQPPPYDDDDRPPTLAPITKPHPTALLAPPTVDVHRPAHEYRSFTQPAIPSVRTIPENDAATPVARRDTTPPPSRKPASAPQTQPSLLGVTTPALSRDLGAVEDEKPQRPSWFLIAAALLLTVISGLTIGYFVFNRGPAHQAQAQPASKSRLDLGIPPVEPRPAREAEPPSIPITIATPPPAQAQLLQPEPEPEPEPKPEPEPELEPQPQPQPVEPARVEPKPKPKPKRRAKPAKPATVILRPGFVDVQVRVGSTKARKLEGSHRMRVRPGTTTLRWRFGDDEKWRKQTLRLEPGRGYIILLEHSGPTIKAILR